MKSTRASCKILKNKEVVLSYFFVFKLTTFKVIILGIFQVVITRILTISQVIIILRILEIIVIAALRIFEIIIFVLAHNKITSSYIFLKQMIPML